MHVNAMAVAAPPALPPRKASKYARALQLAEAYPGQWFKLGLGLEDVTWSHMQQIATSIRNGTLKCAQPRGTFDAVARKDEDGNGAVYFIAVDRYDD